MRSLTKAAVVVAVSLALPVAFAMAQMGPGFGWKQGPRGYYSGPEVPREKIEAAAKAVLEKATKGTEWVSPRGVKHIPILVGKDIVGHLWDDVDLKAVEVGATWAGRFGKHVQLEKDKRVVGMIWLSN